MSDHSAHGDALLPQAVPARPVAHPLEALLQAAALAKNEEGFTKAVEAAMQEPDEAAVALLSPFLGQGAGIGRVAAHGLLMVGLPSLEVLLTVLASGPEPAREHAAWALGSLRDPRAAEALLAALETPAAAPGLVGACLDSLAELGDKNSVMRLTALLTNADIATFRPLVCRALGFIGETRALANIVPLLTHPKPEVRLRAAEASVRLLDRRGWPVLFALLAGEENRGDATLASLRGLGHLSSALAPFMGDDNYHLRRDAAEILGTLGDCRAVPPLLDALHDISPWVRAAAVYSLGRLGDPKALRPMLATLKDAADWVRLSTVRGLSLLGDRRAVEPLEKLLFDRDPEISAAAQDALTMITPARVIRGL